MKALCRKNTKFHFFTQIKVLSNALSHEHNDTAQKCAYFSTFLCGNPNPNPNREDWMKTTFIYTTIYTYKTICITSDNYTLIFVV